MIAIDKSFQPILVTGIQRSGSSLIARILEMSGAFAGQTSTIGSAMCENKKLKLYVDNYYSFLKKDKHGQYPLPNVNRLPYSEVWGSDILEWMEKDGYDGLGPWMYKSSRLGQIWPIWSRAYPSAKWIIVRRKTGDVLNSCIKTGFMDAFSSINVQKKIHVLSEKAGWLWWVHKHEQLYRQMIEAGLNVKVIWPERLLEGNFEQLYEVLDWLGLSWNENIPEFLSIMLNEIKEDK